MPSATYGLALVAEQQEDWRKMFSLLEQVIETEPAHWHAQLKRGQLLLASSEFESALKASKAVLELAPEESAAFAFHAAVLFKLDRQEEAEKAAAAALALEPGHVETVVILANERFAAGRFAEAMTYLDQGLSHSPENIGLSLLKIQSLENSGAVDQASRLYGQLIAANPASDELRRSLADFYSRNGRYDQAEDVLRQLVAEKPDSVAVKLDVVRFAGARLGPAGAKAELEAFIRQSPDKTDLRFALVELQLETNQVADAEAVLRRMIADPNESAARLSAKEKLAGLLFAQGDRQGTITLVDEILATEPRSSQALFLRAAMAVEKRQLDTAISDLRLLLLDSPKSARGLLLLGVAYKLSGSPELAESHFLKAFRVSGESPKYGITFADYLVEEGRLEQAEQVLTLALRVNPGSQVVTERLAQVRLDQRDWVGAEEVASMLAVTQAGQPMADRVRGVIHARKGEHDQSIAALAKAYGASPRNETLALLIEVHIAAGKTDQGMRFLESVIRSAPGNSAALVLMGRLQELQGDDRPAAESFKNAIAANPGRPAGYLSLTGLYLKEGRFTDADKTLLQALDRRPGDPDIMLAQASVFERTDRINDAIEVYEALLVVHPNSDVAANNLASLLSDHRTDDESLNRAYQLAQRFQRSKVPHFRDTLGWASYRTGRYADAVALLAKTVADNAGVPLFHYHLGMSFAATEEPAMARRELRTALAMAAQTEFPQAAEARAALAQIEALPGKNRQ
nr:tetratricopeptide repeat protein [Marinobacter salicampi]